MVRVLLPISHKQHHHRHEQAIDNFGSRSEGPDAGARAGFSRRKHVDVRGVDCKPCRDGGHRGRTVWRGGNTVLQKSMLEDGHAGLEHDVFRPSRRGVRVHAFLRDARLLRAEAVRLGCAVAVHGRLHTSLHQLQLAMRKKGIYYDNLDNNHVNYHDDHHKH